MVERLVEKLWAQPTQQRLCRAFRSLVTMRALPLSCTSYTEAASGARHQQSRLGEVLGSFLYVRRLERETLLAAGRAMRHARLAKRRGLRKRARQDELELKKISL